MKPENVIEVTHVTKKFKVYFDKGQTMKEKVLFRNRRRYEERRVLDDISFSVEKGGAIGLIGENGCGKSTTLKLLTRIMYPNSGNIEMLGRISSLIELGAGFHPDMSGKQNIYTNASIFGLTKKEIDNRLHKIIDFSELKDFIDNPVRTYSSGMYMRLAFSVAINVDADILLIDEILGVGDQGFQQKCFEKLKEIKAKGTTIVIVSHSLAQIEQICERSIWIHDGKIVDEGYPREVHPKYLDYMGKRRMEINTDIVTEEEGAEAPFSEDVVREEIGKGQLGNRYGNGYIYIKRITTTDIKGIEKKTFNTQEDIIIKVDYAAPSKAKETNIGIGIYDSKGVRIYGTNTQIDANKFITLNQEGTICCYLHKCRLLPGKYYVDFALEDESGMPYDFYKSALELDILFGKGDVGVCSLEHSWVIDGETIFSEDSGKLTAEDMLENTNG